MGLKSKIEWTEMTWNPVTGCTKISPGCHHCYAEAMAKRLKNMGVVKYQKGFEVAMHEDELLKPFSWKKNKVVFVNSMSDIFHEEIPENFILQIFLVMNKNPQHVFQVLTKRADRLILLNEKINWTSNIWMGVTVESSQYKERITKLCLSDSHYKFLSLEPLLGPMNNLQLKNIDWVIVGGESGPKSRPMVKEWVIDVRNQCLKNKVPFFFKQWGGKNKKKAGRELEGIIWDQMPDVSLMTKSSKMFSYLKKLYPKLEEWQTEKDKTRQLKWRDIYKYCFKLVKNKDILY